MKTASEPGQQIMKKAYGRETNSGMPVIFLAKGDISLYTCVFARRRKIVTRASSITFSFRFATVMLSLKGKELFLLL
jgi:hypothetical protein